ncbi:aspartyl/asparaginyl beta-hydroxylase domain-containing protein [Simiduia sp. 21SJ11W-1]|uniref:aspartyl/asparaginyl beta-hydroxylase domain-containing protein n=1 Tax=Simiduia sp. 21SJ11W-1 TaxID=2909669 RepID=UPI00209FCEBD|nr:aspartyl/asparaginyl beta-hydroxylase domain-containing protein [Simiduia sp. 21SJ11W-1]UTA47370.1 aspartyl/asparaginyl beta-hydroxylase domain-containing protein [Simiduia sp. 21SJ11W-1]
MKYYDMTDDFPVKFDVEKLEAELQQLEEGAWLEHYDPTLSRGWKSIPLVSKGGEMVGAESQRVAPYSEMKRTAICEKLPYMTSVLDAFKCQHGRIRITRLDPGAGINMHRDISDEVANIAFKKVRLHIPIRTNPGVYFWVDNEIIRMAPGRLYYVNFSKRHYVRNEGDSPRYHIVMDLEVNDWLAGFFPSPGLVDHIVRAVDRLLLPVQWKLINSKVKASIVFWHYYNGSKLQSLRQRFKH